MTEAGSRIVRSFLPVWRRALGDKSGATFAEVAAPHVRLEGSIYATPIDGRLGKSVGPDVFYQIPQVS